MTNRRDSPSAFAFDGKRARKNGLSQLRSRRNTFSGHGGCVDGETVGLVQANIRRDAVSCIENHDIVGDQFDGIDALAPALADHGDAAWEQITKSLAGLFRAVFLKESEHAIEENDNEDCDAELWHAGENRQSPRNPQHDREEMHKLGEKAPPKPHVGRARQEIQTVGLPALLDFVRVQAGRLGWSATANFDGLFVGHGGRTLPTQARFHISSHIDLESRAVHGTTDAPSTPLNVAA